MLTGEYSHSIDAKSRLIIPAKIRDEIGDRFALTRGQDGCLLLYPESEWEEFVMKLQKLPSSKPQVRTIRRFYIGGAMESEFDKQGRILIPANLLEYAGIGKEEEAIVVGVGSHVEIWSAKKWSEDSFDDIGAIAEELDLDF
ncbi:division/cell wall cluster transcriptional repressor MraZ [Butyrivibrio sp. NC3005]|uniref:division/cell wall cluster transcriptional repressor MraZ n=1 Tax=Butyrivibrio sp. NC3005 TaxID=1280685 RepID=UPI0004237AF9|nr:division/cell wall cluster transcriptional repressor MraZ [Butyrivibrio sp. NC3005]